MRRASSLLALLALACTEERPAPPRGWFTDVASEAGVEFTHDAGMTEERHLPETMAGGAVVADFDGDEDLDLFCLQSGALPGAPPGKPRPGNALFLNQLAEGEPWRFVDASAELGAARDTGYGMGCTAGDVDDDGDLDLFTSAFGPVHLLLNDGRGRFDDATARAGIRDERWTAGATFFDADRDGDLDLYCTGYVEVDLSHPEWCGKREPGWRSYCHPDAYAGLPSRFWRNRGDGTFEEATAAVGLSPPPGNPGKGLGAIAVDLDADGWLDLYQANDSVEQFLFMNRAGRFEDATLLSGTGVNARGLTTAGMGLASGDIDGDLDPDLFLTNFDDESNSLYRNDGGGLFTDVAAEAGIDAASRPWVGFGVVLDDLDADGDLDLAVTNGHIIHNIHLYSDGKTWAQRSQLFTNDGRGRFTEATEAAGDLSARPLVGRGLYSGDLDADGDLDLLLTQCNGPALLLRNERGGRALVLRGIPRGARVLAQTSDGRELLRLAGPQPSYCGQSSGEVHLGLGTARLARLRIAPTWGPGFEVNLPPDLDTGTVRLVIERDAARLEPAR